MHQLIRHYFLVLSIVFISLATQATASRSEILNNLVLAKAQHFPPEFSEGLVEVIAWIDFLEGRDISPREFLIARMREMLANYKTTFAGRIPHTGKMLPRRAKIYSFDEIKARTKSIIHAIRNGNIDPNPLDLETLARDLTNCAVFNYGLPGSTLIIDESYREAVPRRHIMSINKELGILSLVHAALLGYFATGIQFDPTISAHTGFFLGSAAYLEHDYLHASLINEAIVNGDLNIDFYARAYERLLLNTDALSLSKNRNIFFLFSAVHEFYGEIQDEKLAKLANPVLKENILFTTGDLLPLLNRYFVDDNDGEKWATPFLNDNDVQARRQDALDYNRKFVAFFAKERDGFFATYQSEF